MGHRSLHRAENPYPGGAPTHTYGYTVGYPFGHTQRNAVGYPLCHTFRNAQSGAQCHSHTGAHTYHRSRYAA